MQLSSQICDDGRNSANEHFGISGQVCDSSRSSSSEHMGLAEKICAAGARTVDVVSDNGRQSAAEHARIGAELCDVSGRLQQAINNEGRANSAEHCKLAEACGTTEKELTKEIHRARSELAELVRDMGRDSRAASERVHNFTEKRLESLARDVARQHTENMVTHKEQTIEILKLGAAQAKDAAEHKFALMQQAAENKCALSKQLSDCCCETKEAIMASAAATQTLIREQATAALQSALADAKQNNLILSIQAGLINNSPLAARNNGVPGPAA